jgi:hypothetical protein
MAATLFHHPFDEPGGVAVNRCVLVDENEWFDVPCTLPGGWRLRMPYFGPKSGLRPISEPTAREIRRALDDSSWF